MLLKPVRQFVFRVSALGASNGFAENKVADSEPKMAEPERIQNFMAVPESPRIRPLMKAQASRSRVLLDDGPYKFRLMALGEATKLVRFRLGRSRVGRLDFRDDPLADILIRFDENLRAKRHNSEDVTTGQ